MSEDFRKGIETACGERGRIRKLLRFGSAHHGALPFVRHRSLRFIRRIGLGLRCIRILSPRRKDGFEDLIAGFAFLDGKDRALLVRIDSRDIEPRPLQQQLQVTRAIGGDIRRPNEKKNRR